MGPVSFEIQECEFARAAAGLLYYLAPGYRPRNADLIMQKAMSAFRSKSKKSCFGTFVWSVPEDRLFDELEKLFMAIPEFVDLNLSEDELERGVKVDDENRPPFNFVSGYDIKTEESVRHDFIDLTAFIQNLNLDLSKTHSKLMME